MEQTNNTTNSEGTPVLEEVPAAIPTTEQEMPPKEGKHQQFVVVVVVVYNLFILEPEPEPARVEAKEQVEDTPSLQTV